MTTNSAHVEDPTVTILQAEYDQLLEDSRFLECLRRNGVDNWDWYGEACEEFEVGQ